MLASERSVYDVTRPGAIWVAVPFHVVQFTNRPLDECRRHVQKRSLGRHNRLHDSIWRAKRHLLLARERLAYDQHDWLMGLLTTGDLHREVWFAPNAREFVRQISARTDHQLAVEWVAEIGRDLAHSEIPSSRFDLPSASSGVWPIKPVQGSSHRFRVVRPSGEQPRQTHQKGCVRALEIPPALSSSPSLRWPVLPIPSSPASRRVG
jgi:hypothetical protein